MIPQQKDFPEGRPTESSSVTGKPNPPAGRRRRWPWLLGLAAIVFAVSFFWMRTVAAQSTKSRATAGREAAARAVPVTGAVARIADLGVYLSGLGSVTPVKTVTVHTRVDGQLVNVAYKEGQLVREGDLLAEIDPRPFQVQLHQAEGQMARDVAQLQNARIDLERFRTLWAQDSIAKQQLDTQEFLIRQLEGTIKNDQGQIDSAKLNLIYCQITAPISGRVGLRLVDPGNIVHAADTNGLVVITQLQPITVIFPIPEDSLPQVLAGLKSGAHLRVEAYDRDLTHRLAVGSLLTVDNQIDPTTGTVKLRATFPNEGNELFPNQFVNARLLVDVRRGVIVVPAPAIQRGPQGTFVYVVKPDRTATIRPVTVGEIQEAEASIRTGLSAGEIVVVDGAERLREGVRVELKAPGGGPPPKAY